MQAKSILFVTAGGALGSLFRMMLGLVLPFHVHQFAWATFSTNMAGCFAIGLCYPYFENPLIRYFLIVGVLGGFTTFSGMGLELLRYIESRETALAVLYGLGSVILGTVLVWLGYRISA